MSAEVAIEPPFASRRLHAFYGVSQGGAGHAEVVLLQKACHGRFVFFAHFAQHPSYGFVYQVVSVAQMSLCDAEYVVEIAFAYECEACDYGYSLMPQVAALR